MAQTVAALAALFLSAGLFIIGHGLMLTLVSVTLAGRHLDLTLVSIIVSGYYAGFVLGSLLGPRIIGRVGHIRAFAAFCSAVAIAILLHPMLPAGLGWLILRMAHGFAVAVLYVATESWLNDRVPDNRRGAIMSLYMIISFAALGFGQYGLTLGDPDGYELFSVAAMLFAVALVPIALVKVETPGFGANSGAAPRSLTFLKLYAISPLGIIGCALVGMVNGSFYVMGPVYGRLIGLDNSGVTWFMNAAVAGGLLMQWPIGRMSDRFDRRRVLVGVSLVAMLLSVAIVVGGLFAASLGLDGADPRVLLALCLVILVQGGCMFTLYPLCTAHAQDFAAPDQRVGASASLLLAFGLGAVVGPPISGRLMSAIGPAGLFVQATVITLALALFAIYRISKRAPLPADERKPFMSQPPASIGARIATKSEEA